MKSTPRIARRLLPLLIAAVLSSGSALAATPAKTPKAPTAQQQAAREEIERLTTRIEELSKQLGDDGQVRVIVRRVGPGEGPGDDDVIIRRFGRFPHRNAALGRESTAEEIIFLAGPDSSF